MAQVAGPSYRHLVDLSNMENSLFLNPLGQSGDMFNYLYDNLLEAWSIGKYMNMGKFNVNNTDVGVLNYDIRVITNRV